MGFIIKLFMKIRALHILSLRISRSQNNRSKLFVPRRIVGGQPNLNPFCFALEVPE